MGQSIYKPRHLRGKVGKVFNGRKAIDDLYWTKDWTEYRVRFLDVNPWCYSCGAKATVVDHLTPHQGDEKLFRKLDNHIPLCKHCHDVITASFDRRHRAGNPITKKLQWIARERAKRDLTSRVRVMPSYP